jgi:hypothetical protein
MAVEISVAMALLMKPLFSPKATKRPTTMLMKNITTPSTSLARKRGKRSAGCPALEDEVGNGAGGGTG